MDEPSSDVQPEGERWDPLGAANDPESDEEVKDNKHTRPYHYDCYYCAHSSEKFHALEEEHEILISSLLSLTTHFAQIQFRLRQIVHAPVNDKENLLRSLEEFAFSGIPDVNTSKNVCDVETANKQIKQYQQKELIDQLKRQLKELENYSFETSETIGYDKQRFTDEFEEIQSRQVRGNEICLHQVTAAAAAAAAATTNNLINPTKMKEYLVQQLKTQVADLERFIQFLQNDVENKHCTCSKQTKKSNKPADLHDSIHIVKRVAALLQMFTMLQFGCGTGNNMNRFRKNDLKTTMKANHWGDMRARLQIIVSRILQTDSLQDENDMGNYNSDTEDSSETVLCKVRITHTVRKQLATCLRELIQHGLTMKRAQSVSLVPLMECFAKKSIFSDDEMHAWDLILEYYAMKNGEYYNSTPVRKLSQSFNLDIIGGNCISNKQSFLSTIGNIITTHTIYKRSNDSHFKAFVCAGLNCNKLVAWLKLIFQCKHLIHKYYEPWSYAAQTGFQDTLQCLDVLTPLKFDLPVDLAIQQFQNIKDVFI